MYSQSLEAELKKLQATTKDSTERFEENLRKLAGKKLKCQMAIFQVSGGVGSMFIYWCAFGFFFRLFRGRRRRRHQCATPSQESCVILFFGSRHRNGSRSYF